jgi:hypothetical protein
MSSTNEFKMYIRLLCRFLLPVFLLVEYDYEIHWMRVDEGADDGGGIAARISMDHVYLNFQLQIFPRLRGTFEEGTLHQVAAIVVHEFSHLLTQPMYCEALADAAPSQVSGLRDLNERQTQRVANVVMASLPKNWYKPATLKKAIS